MRRSAALAAALSACVAVGGAACVREPLDTVAAVNQALVKGDLAAVEARVHPDYADPLGGRDVLLRDLRALLEAHGPPKIEVEGAEIAGGTTVLGKQTVRFPVVTLVGPLDMDTFRRTVRSGLLDDLRGIEALLAARKAALEANDAGAYGELLHPLYKDGDLDRDAARARLAKDLAGVPIRYEIVHHEIEVRGLIAHADERFILTIGETVHPQAVSRLTLTRAGGLWRISAGLY